MDNPQAIKKAAYWLEWYANILLYSYAGCDKQWNGARATVAKVDYEDMLAVAARLRKITGAEVKQMAMTMANPTITAPLTDEQRVTKVLEKDDYRVSAIARILHANPDRVLRIILKLRESGAVYVARTEPARADGCGQRINVYGLTRTNPIIMLLRDPWPGTRVEAEQGEIHA